MGFNPHRKYVAEAQPTTSFVVAAIVAAVGLVVWAFLG